jgi:hypothetical protein
MLLVILPPLSLDLIASVSSSSNVFKQSFSSCGNLAMVSGVNLPCQRSRKLLSALDRLRSLSLRNAFVSIYQMRSRVTENCRPTSSVWSVFIPMPNRVRSTRSSRAVSEASARVVVSRRFD